MASGTSSTLDGLPKQFVASLRTLFEIMDDKHTGFVNFADIEARWQDDGSKELPKGVLESLRKVTPPNGLLSFERFCAGLKICLLRNQVEKRNEVGIKPQDMKASGQTNNRPPSAPLLDLVDNNNIMNRDINEKSSWGLNNNTAAIRPNNIINPQQRSSSMTQLKDVQNEITFDKPEKHGSNIHKDERYNKPPLYGPPKPPRTALGLDRAQLDRTQLAGLDRNGLERVGVLDRLPMPHTGGTTGNLDRAEIRNALANWQMGLINNQDNGKNLDKQKLTISVSNGSNGTDRQQVYSGGLLRTSRSLGDGKPQQELQSPRDLPAARDRDKSGSNSRDVQREIALQSPRDMPQVQLQGLYQKKPNARRREPRRHTLQNGIDYNMLKRMKQIEQEKEVLMTGLTAVERAREWYLKQVAAVQEKMKYLGRMGHVETWSEAQQERLELQRARVLEVNRHLAALTESWERGGLPLHMNLAVHHYPPHHEMSERHAERLKQQNRLLTEELNKKGDRISSLEREKASLIQMLQIRSPPSRSNHQTHLNGHPSNGHLNGHSSNGQEEAVF